MLNLNSASLTSVMCGAISATIFSCGLYSQSFLLILLSPFLTLPIFWSGLSGGIRYAIYASLVALVLTRTVIDSNFAIVVIALSQYLPVCLIVWMALRQRERNGEIYWYPLRRMAVFMCFLSVVKCLIDYILYADITNNPLFMEVVNQSYALQEDGAFEKMQQILLYIPGFSSLGWILMLILNGMIAQSMLMKRGLNLRPNFDVRDFCMPGYFVVILGILLAGYQFTQYPVFFINLMVSLSWCVFLNGQLLAHSTIQKYIGKSSMIIGLSYLIGILFWPFMIAVGIARGISQISFNRR